MPLKKNVPRSGPGRASRQPMQVVPGLGVDVPELQTARSLWLENRFDEALELFEKVAAKYPQNLVALVDGSRALGARFEITRAESLLDRLVKLAGKNPELLHLAGQSYRMIFRPEKAIQCFERVNAISTKIPDTKLELAVLYERRHRVSEALDLMEQCLREAPDYLEAELFKARLLRRLKDSSSAAAIFRRLADDERAHPLVRAQAWNELATQLDREGDYGGAMSALLKSKEFVAKDEAPFLKESEALQNCLGSLAVGMTAERVEKWRADGKNFPEQKMAVLASFPR
jgi:tetratricopeptide (TPR) repeat protein